MQEISYIYIYFEQHILHTYYQTHERKIVIRANHSLQDIHSNSNLINAPSTH